MLRSSRSWRERQCCTARLWHNSYTNHTLYVHLFQEERQHLATCKRSGEKWVMWNKEHFFRRFESWCCLPRSMTWHPRGVLIKASVVLLPFCLSVFCISEQAVCSQSASACIQHTQHTCNTVLEYCAKLGGTKKCIFILKLTQIELRQEMEKLF